MTLHSSVAVLSCFSIARLMHVAVSGRPDGCFQATSVLPVGCMVSGGWLRVSGAGAPGHAGAAVNRPQPHAGRPAAIAVLSCFSIARLMHIAVPGRPDGCLQATGATCGVHGKRWVAQGKRCGCSRPRWSSSRPATAPCRAASCHRGAVMLQHREADPLVLRRGLSLRPDTYYVVDHTLP
jgi:hypothetical protein